MSDELLWTVSVKKNGELVIKDAAGNVRFRGTNGAALTHFVFAMQSHDKLSAAVRKLRAACDTYRDMLTCYRIGKRPSEALLKRMDEATAALEETKEYDA